MSKLYRSIIIGILTFALVSACGMNSVQQVTSQADENPNENVRVIEHALGKTQVPINPQRVIVLGGGLDIVLSLGIKPIGSVNIGEEYLKSKVEGIESVGASGSPNLEAIVALNPDLILGAEWDKKSYEPLSQIAPTVISEVNNSGEWKELLHKYAEALGKTDKVKQVMADYHTRIEEFQAQMGDRLQETEVSIVRLYQSNIEIYLEDSFCGTIVADAGLPRPHYQTNTEQKSTMEISKELLHIADGDAIFVWTFGHTKEIAEDAQKALKELKADPLWSQLNAVQQGQAYDVPGYWVSMGPIAANLVLDDLFKYLVDSPPQAAQ